MPDKTSQNAKRLPTAKTFAILSINLKKEASMDTVEFRDMAYVLAVYENRSFSKTAEQKFISQPALSKTVKKVERHLGITIFNRGSIPLTVTPEGERILEYFRRIQASYQEMEHYCDTVRTQKKCDLTIVSPSFFCTYILPPVVSDFQASNPEYDIKLMEANDCDLREFLRAQIADIGISVDSDVPAYLELTELKREMIILAVPSAYEVNHRLEEFQLRYDDMVHARIQSREIPGVPMDVFSKERFLFLKKGNDIWQRGMKICHDAGFSPRIVMELDQLLTAYYLAAAGEGITFTRSNIPCCTGYTDKLCFYKINHPDTIRPVHILQNSGCRLNEKQKKFIEFLKQYPLPGLRT